MTESMGISGRQVSTEQSTQGRNLSDIAYDRIEEVIVHLKIRPGEFTTVSALQQDIELGRTPVLDAVRRLADDTLVLVQSRRGLQVAPIQLDRERRLLKLRADVEKHAVRLAAERANSTHRSRMFQLVQALKNELDGRNIHAFNELDRMLDMLVLDAADEPLILRTLRPLHSIFRRTGYIYLAHLDSDGEAFVSSIERHAVMLDAIARGHQEDAVGHLTDLINLAEGMFDTMARKIDPTLLDINIQPLSL
ncbi:DNA-binding transcriptional regulator, GntR family [Cohaesibacter marisflavi]|uniref:DNA-binding transcriptional regulator, GntR family n=1 Tax=Cohaesibacter marisflavi TaxID=655353 RepID=A0A1I5M430_9HYPH|nr:GntR family transcriptional regulator [Cohaesibacter marisflavi]SFP04364.1 DNA-binding transcriptional regulator, GntR family [Cohaesibacter marisflavi]